MAPGAVSGGQPPLDAACRYLAYRPRSELEVRDWLKRKGYDLDKIEATVEALKGKGFLDDVAFARYWRESRESARPRSRSALMSELRRKGIDRETAAAALMGVDERAAAYRAGNKRAARLASTNLMDFRRRVSDSLRRKGFSYEIIEETVNRLYEENRKNG